MENTRHRITPIYDNFPYKVELHVHLDGAIRLSTLLDIASRRKIPLKQTTIDDFRREICVYHAKSRIQCLASFKIFMPIVAGDREAISRMAYEFCEDCAGHNIQYVEARYSPHLLANCEDTPEHALQHGDLTPREVVEIINAAFKRDWSEEVVLLATEFRPDGVVGIDIAGGSVDKDDVEEIDDQHKVAFKKAKALGIRITAHAGESGPASRVIESLRDLHADRIGHGYHCVDDDDVYSEVRRLGIHLETCPLSSFCTGAVDGDLRKHPIVRFARDRVNFSINSDDPLLFDSCLLDDYNAAAKQMGLTQEQIIQTTFNAARSCFALDDEKQAILRELAAVYGDKYLQ